MIRWRYIFTRLIIVAIILVLLRWGLGPAAKFVTARSLESATGAKVDIDKTRIGFFPPRIQYLDVQVADPRGDKEMQNAFQAESIELTIDGNALLHRRWVASDGRITGIQIGAQRATSGHYAEEIEEPPAEPAGPSMLSKLLRGAVGSAGSSAESALGELETTKRSKQIKENWERDYHTLVARARALEKQIREIRDSARGIDNPLRDWAEMDRTLARATEARNQLTTVREAINSLPERLQSDLASMEEAKQIDLAKVDSYLPGDLSESSNFGVDLMTAAIRNQVQRVRDYMDSGKTLANYTVVAPESERVRGTDFDLLGDNRQTNMLVRRCEIGGLMRADGNSYAVTGILENLTPTPELLTEPTRARLRLEGPETIRVEFIRDRRDGADVDLLTLHWPQTEVDTMRFGGADDGIVVEGGQRELWVQVRSEDEQMQGRLVSKQTGVHMNLNVDDRYADTPAVVSLQQSLAAVNSIEIDAEFTGTWRDMDINLNSNLGQIFQRATQDAIAGQVQATKAQLASKVNQAHAKQSKELREWLGSRQTEARSLLASADQSIEEMSRKVINEMGDADAYLGKLRSAIKGKLR